MWKVIWNTVLKTLLRSKDDVFAFAEWNELCSRNHELTKSGILEMLLAQRLQREARRGWTCHLGPQRAQSSGAQNKVRYQAYQVIFNRCAHITMLACLRETNETNGKDVNVATLCYDNRTTQTKAENACVVSIVASASQSKALQKVRTIHQKGNYVSTTEKSNNRSTKRTATTWSKKYVKKK